MNATATAGCPPLLPPETTPCARGACVDELTCGACEDGWVPHADFAFGAPACVVSVGAVRALWAMAAVAGVVTLVGTVVGVGVVVRGAVQGYHRAATNEDKKAARVRMHAEALVVMVAALTSAVSAAALGIVRASDPSRAIGTDAAASWLFTSYGVGFWASMVAMTARFTRVAAGVRSVAPSSFSALARWQMDAGARFFASLAFVSVTGHVMPAAMLLATTPAQMAAMATTFFLANAACASLAYFLGVFSILKPLARILKERNVAFQASDAQFEKVVRKFDRFATLGAIDVMVVTVTFVLWGVWPFLQQRCSAYLIPITVTGVQCLLLLSVGILIPVRRDGRGRGARSASTSGHNHGGVGGGGGVGASVVVSSAMTVSVVAPTVTSTPAGVKS